jgi:hypothetical protein
MPSPTVFVSVASYRDKYCTRTLESMYENSSNPANLIVGLCIQNDEGDEPCFLKNPALAAYKHNIRTINLTHYEAKGPTWARYLCTTLMQNEDYFLQVDSHTLFDKDWDAKMIAMVTDIKANTSSKDVVLSHYPPLYEEYGNPNRDKKVVDTICQSFFNERGMVSFLGAEGVDMKKHKYVQTPHIAAGMFFCEGKCIKEVPYDPHLPNLFVGEEILHSARVWTAGYDIYTPNENVVYHLYTRADQPHIWDDKKDYNDEDAFNKAKMILGFENNLDAKVPTHVKANLDKYGLGKKRSLKQFFEFAGIDAENKRIYKNFCPQHNGIVKNDESYIAKMEKEKMEKMMGKKENFKEGKKSMKDVEDEDEDEDEDFTGNMEYFKEGKKSKKDEDEDEEDDEDDFTGKKEYFKEGKKGKDDEDDEDDEDDKKKKSKKSKKDEDEEDEFVGEMEGLTGMSSSSSIMNWSWKILFKMFWIFIIFLACVITYEPKIMHRFSHYFGKTKVGSIFDFFRSKKNKK